MFLFLSQVLDSIAPVAQLDRASDYGSEGWEFESSRARQDAIFFLKINSFIPPVDNKKV